MKIRMFSLLAISYVLTGCFQAQYYVTRPDPIEEIDIQMLSGDKIPGTWLYVIDDSVATASRQIKASSHACSLHIYPVDAGDSILSSVSNVMGQIFENTLLRETLPKPGVVVDDGLSGTIYVGLDNFDPKFYCFIAQKEGYCNAKTDLSLSVIVVTYPDGKKKSIHASSQKISVGNSGEMCVGASDVIAKSVRDTIKAVLEIISKELTLANVQGG